MQFCILSYFKFYINIIISQKTNAFANYELRITNYI